MPPPASRAPVGGLSTSEVTSVKEQSHALGTTADVLVGLRIAGHDLTAIVLIDHKRGTVVEDAFFLPEPAGTALDRFRSQLGEHADLYPCTDIYPADARARITEAIDRGAKMVPPVETETWPRCRPLLEWVLGLLPEGASSDERLDRPGPRGTGFDPALLPSIATASDPGDEDPGSLERRAGGPASLAALTDDPLPDESFDWSGIEPDITDRVAEVLALGDAFAGEHFGVEFRTATRRLLATIASRAPQVFRRRGADSSAAAAVAWLVGRDNHLFSASPGFTTVKDLLASFGRSGSVSTRAETMLINAGLLERFERFFCPPELLLGATRGRLIDERDSTQGSGSFGPVRTAPAELDRARRQHGRTSPGIGTVHRLKVTVEHIRPPVWRRLLVPSDLTLADLHQILQVSFGWYDAHLHDFEIGGTRYDAGDDEFGGFGFDMGLESIDEASVTLAEVLGEGARGLYNYDFGDDWCHRIVVEAVEPREASATYPRCIAGRRSGPPEDVGGPWGYGEFLAALDDPGHEEHELYLEWSGGGWDPEAFDQEMLEEQLRELPLSSD